jgi:hypothetical protein
MTAILMPASPALRAGASLRVVGDARRDRPHRRSQSLRSAFGNLAAVLEARTILSNAWRFLLGQK